MKYLVRFMYAGIELISFQRITLESAMQNAYFHKQYIGATIEIYKYGKLICVIQDESRCEK